jgi:CRISPR/Cas system-associated exonuclease Cas4 (RecB family)
MLDLHKVNASSLNSYMDCSQKFYYENIEKRSDGIPVDDTPMLLGKAFHQAIEDYYRYIPAKPDVRDIDFQVRKTFEQYLGTDFPHLHQKIERIVENFINFEVKRLHAFKQFKPTFTEKYLEIQFDGIIINGSIDAYWESDAICVDWKTGRTHEDNFNRQGTIYRSLLTKNNYPCKKVLFVLLDDNTTYEVPFTTEAWLKQEIEYMRRGVIFPNRGPHCAWCPYVISCEFQGVNLWDL